MGSVSNITFDKFPEQHKLKMVKVCFHFDTERSFIAEVVRDDKEAPWITIFKLPDNRHVLSTECQFQYLDN